MSNENIQLVSFVLDNSASVSKEKLSELMGGFRRLAADAAKYPMLDWELLCFDGFAPTVIKSFEKTEILPVRAGRMPLLGRAMQAAAERLLSRYAVLEKEGKNPYRPWLFVISDGFTFDEPAEAATMLDGWEKEGRVVYLPFKISPKLYNGSMQAMDRVKHMITVKQGGIESFFAFFASLLDRRAQSGGDAALKFSKNDFEGWAEL